MKAAQISVQEIGFAKILFTRLAAKVDHKNDKSRS
jgi:hypothetical protein